MHQGSEKYYDLIYSLKDYKTESEKIRSFIDTYRPGAKKILDVACGSSEHAKFLKKHLCQGARF